MQIPLAGQPNVSNWPQDLKRILKTCPVLGEQTAHVMCKTETFTPECSSRVERQKKNLEVVGSIPIIHAPCRANKRHKNRDSTAHRITDTGKRVESFYAIMVQWEDASVVRRRPEFDSQR